MSAMLIDHTHLMPIKVLVTNAEVHVELFQNNNGNLFLSSSSNKPKGIVYYATTASLLSAFFEDSITLQELFTSSPSFFAEVNENSKTTLYYIPDSEIKLACGDKRVKQLTGINPLEIWEAVRGI